MKNASPVPLMLMTQQLGPGGTERQLTEVARLLDRSRFHPHVACFWDGPRGDELRAAGVPVLVLPLRSFRSLSVLREALVLRRYLREHRIRIVHAFDYPLACFGVPVARWARVPVVISSQRADRRLNPIWYQRFHRVTDRMVDAVVVNCEAMRRHVIEDQHVPSALVRLCYNALDTSRFAASPLAPEKPVVIGTVAVLRPEKGIDLLIAAFSKLEHEDMRLLIVGSGPESARLQSMAHAVVGERCRIEPATTDVAAKLREISIFVLPSHSEALSNSLMEAMACGRAVIASRVGGNPELVTHEENGLLFDPGNIDGLTNCIKRLIEDGELRCRLGAAAARTIRERFSLAASVRSMEEIYMGLLKQ